ncbi:bifunctional biotin--[acetyl-CoA-carboxylase] ligase/biotin operon repressor BirA [Streptococcus tangpeifui]|uniref:bifunctional biotin--[acetyl-CoA-carboxylase] ligase/biotin operon repressor BirA n=1 Tax=Streptococcus tangpeifui TaxID=2709400 RepID=UPI0013ED1D2D|nr:MULTISPECIES: bifunctional biotin--[acetyl-CoA-carboxylase] ligase/biotin operon repressor BirA [unclassified Streptococcus]
MKTYEKIYKILHETDSFVSGQDLAEQLEVSRTAIWKSMKVLENKGLVIESVKNRGYHLVLGDLLLPKEISQATGLKVYYNETSSSTQLDAKEGIEKEQTSPALYLAPNQKNARGRFARPFFSPESGGIYMSLHLQPNLPHDQAPAYTLMVASSIVKAISRLTGIDCQIKWVNDIYLGHKKLAGILTEAISSIETGLITDVIIGVGLNFLVPEFPKDLRDKAASLFTTQTPITRNQLISEIWNIFLETPERDLIKVYKEKSLVLDKRVTFVENQLSYAGLATDITDSGQLVVQLDDGQEKLLNSGEISLSSWES